MSEDFGLQRRLLPTSSLNLILEHQRRYRRPWADMVAELKPYTEFEKRIIKTSSMGIPTFRGCEPVIENCRIIGYYRRSNGYEELRNRNGKVVWSEEAALRSPFFTPVDLVGSGTLKGVARAGKAALNVAGRSLRGAPQAAVRLVSNVSSQTTRLARGLLEMRVVAKQLLAKNARSSRPARDIFLELTEELSLEPARRGPQWKLVGKWSDVRRHVYRLIFNRNSLPFNRRGEILVSVHHIVEKYAGGQHSASNLLPILQRIHNKVSGLYNKKVMIQGKRVRFRDWVQNLPHAEQRGIGNEVLFQTITKADEIELARLMKSIGMQTLL